VKIVWPIGGERRRRPSGMLYQSGGGRWRGIASRLQDESFLVHFLYQYLSAYVTILSIFTVVADDRGVLWY